MKKYLVPFVALVVFVVAGCSADDDEKGDIVKVISMSVSEKTGITYDLFDTNAEYPIECMLVKEEGGNGQWQNLMFGAIEGFTYEKGHAYELKVRKTILANPPADGSNCRYKLIEILEDRTVTEPETPEELKEVLIAFRDQDPNGDGLQNEIPFTFQDAWGWARSIENLFGAFGVLENDDHVFTRDGEVIFSAREQGYYDTLIYLNDLYREGLIDKDVFTLSSDQYAARGASGDILGLVAGYRSSDAGVYDTEAYQVLPILKQEDGSQMVGINNVTKTGGFVITQSCKNPEILVRWYDYINSSLELALEWGRGAEGVAWNIVEVDGEEVAQQLTMDSEVLKANGGYSSAAEYRAAESFAGVTPSLYRYEYFEKQIKDEDIRSEALKEQIPYGVTGLPAGTASQENEEQRSILLTDIDTYLKKFVADSVINGIDDAKWQEHLDTLESLKVDEYTRLCQEFVDSMAE